MIGFEAWRRSMPFGDPPSFVLTLHPLAYALIQAAFTISLYLSPVVFLVARPRRWSVRPGLIGVAVLGLALAIAVRFKGSVFLGNYLDRHGAYGAAAVGARDVLPAALMVGLAVVACFSMALAAGTLLEAGVHLDRTSWALGLALLGGTFAQAAVGQGVFARYLLPVLPIVAVPLLNSLEPPRWKLALSTVAAVGAVSLALTSNGLAFDAARWRAAQDLQQAGVAAQDIDAGLEWVGYHANGPAHSGVPHPEAIGWYMNMFPASRECYLVSASPVSDQRPIAVYGFKTYALFGHSHLWIYKESPCR